MRSEDVLVTVLRQLRSEPLLCRVLVLQGAGVFKNIGFSVLEDKNVLKRTHCNTSTL